MLSVVGLYSIQTLFGSLYKHYKQLIWFWDEVGDDAPPNPFQPIKMMMLRQELFLAPLSTGTENLSVEGHVQRVLLAAFS
jgi:hypothetical protein